MSTLTKYAHFPSLCCHAGDLTLGQMNAEAAKGNPNANLSFLNAVKVVEAEKLSDTTARIVYSIPVMKEYLNPSMTLHGGQQAAFYDIGTSWLLYLVRRPVSDELGKR